VSDLTTAILAKLVQLDGAVGNAVSEFPKLDRRIELTERTILERVGYIETKMNKMGEKMDFIEKNIGVSLVIIEG
jgi:hypothetical protein